MTVGAANVSAVYTRWSYLPDRAFRVLAFMALVSLDNGTPPRYWGGREALAHALGRVVPAEPAPDDATAPAVAYRKARHAAFESVRSALRELVATGAVAKVGPAKPGRNAEYALHLWATGQVHPAPSVQVHPAPSVQVHPANGTGSVWTMGQGGSAPEEQAGSRRLHQDTTSVESTTSGPLREALARIAEEAS